MGTIPGGIKKMTLYEEHQDWQREKIMKVLDRDYEIVKQRSNYAPEKSTIEDTVWFSTEGRQLMNKLMNVPEDLKPLVKEFRDKLYQKDEQSKEDNTENTRKRHSLPETDLELIINSNKGSTELILPFKEKDIKEGANPVAKRIYDGCIEVIKSRSPVREENNLEDYLVVILPGRCNQKELAEKLKNIVEPYIKSYKLSIEPAYSMNLHHSYNKDHVKINGIPKNMNGTGKKRLKDLEDETKINIILDIARGKSNDDLIADHPTLLEGITEKQARAKIAAFRASHSRKAYQDKEWYVSGLQDQE
jgi:hypothetical protein